MTYKGMEVTGANGVDYSLSPTSKKPTLAEYLDDIHSKTTYYPYVVCSKDRQLTEQEKRWCVEVSEIALLKFSYELGFDEYTFVVLPDCCDVVKDMFRCIGDNNASHAEVVFFDKEEDA